MKRTKKLLALLLALVMAMAMNISAFAAKGNLTGGTITVSNTVSGETYSIYQIAYLESYNEASGAYAYKVNSAWADFLGESPYVRVDNGYVSWYEDTYNASDVANFVEDALVYAQENSITPDNSQEASSDTVEFSNLNLGWYLVDSSLGALCSLDTTNTSMTVKDKNDEPSITKKVQEDSTTTYGDSATIDSIDTINYQLTVTVGAGVDQDYTIVDTLPEGLSYDETTGASITGWDQSNYSVNYDTDDAGHATMTIVLDAEKLASVNTVTIVYSATASSTLVADEAYTNTVELTYKSQKYTDTATVKTYDIGGSAEGTAFTKVDGSDKTTPLAGVKFVLGKGNQYATFDDNGYLTGWVNSQEEATELVTDEAGHIYAYGLDADKYVLTETETLPGYNLLADTITVSIDENGTVSYKYTNSADPAGPSITVVNNSGSILPSTGGMGTTVIYMAGAALVIVAGITLVVRRRMRAE